MRGAKWKLLVDVVWLRGAKWFGFGAPKERGSGCTAEVRNKGQPQRGRRKEGGSCPRGLERIWSERTGCGSSKVLLDPGHALNSLGVKGKERLPVFVEPGTMERTLPSLPAWLESPGPQAKDKRASKVL